MKTIQILISAVLLFTSACSASDENNTPENQEPETMQTIVDGNTSFAFDLYGRLKDTKGNLFFSPYSISTALAMTYTGADGITADQMQKTLHFPRFLYRDSNPFHAGYGRLINQLNQQGQKGDYQLLIANALWGQKGYEFLDSFIAVNNRYYNAGLENVDFVNETEQARQTINQWVEDKTQDKIKDLIPQGALDAMTRLVLTNAIYFKGDWVQQFDKKQTKDAPFYLLSGETIQAPLMQQKEKFRYGETDELQLLELPYKDDELSMLVLLPKEKDGLEALEKQLTAENLAQWQKKVRKQEVQVFLPKFTIVSQFSLSHTLSAMGMPDAFSGNADFSGMSGNKKLFISDVIHKAYVEVNEEGTEAAAATGVVVGLTAMPAPPPVFRADHPFVFVIKDNKTGSLLFLGRMMDPTKEK
jgi:serine protease inhibitor